LDDAFSRTLARDILIYDRSGVFTPTRSIQGALNSALQFQARMTAMFKDLFYKLIIVWTDDIFGHSSTERDWFSLLETILERLERYNVKLTIVVSERSGMSAMFYRGFFLASWQSSQ
jgi:hypothetical protein